MNNKQITTKIKKPFVLSVLISISFLSGCSVFDNSDGPPIFPVDISHVKEPVPKAEPKSKYGNPKKYSVFGKQYTTLESSEDFTEHGIASWYGTKFHGRRTSSGERYDMYALTGAHKSLPLPTYAKVTNLDNNKSLVIKINDRGPFHDERILDLSYAAAAKLGVLGKGTANIKLTTINPNKKSYAYSKQELVQLQLGAFKDRYNAENLVKAAAKIIDIPLKITRNTNQQEENIFKVQTSKFSIDKINLLKSKLEKINIKNPITLSMK